MKFREMNERMIEDLISSGALRTPRIIEAFRSIPRHLFVLKKYLPQAYEDHPLPTMRGQTISQPYTVAVMLEALRPRERDKVLEIGTGSGWTACLLAKCVGEGGRIITIDVFSDLINFAKKNVKKTGLKNVEVILGDGKLGYPKEAPYDQSLINAACEEIPRSIIEQVKVGGRIVAPVGGPLGQRLIVVTKESRKKTKKKDLGPYMFVPLR